MNPRTMQNGYRAVWMMLGLLLGLSVVTMIDGRGTPSASVQQERRERPTVIAAATVSVSDVESKLATAPTSRIVAARSSSNAQRHPRRRSLTTQPGAPVFDIGHPKRGAVVLGQAR